MECTFDNFKKLNLKTELLSLEDPTYMYPYWCYPTNAKPIVLEGRILYCFIEGYNEIVFSSNPESCFDTNVYPPVRNFKDFMRLILACGSANPIEQIVWMDKGKFEEHLNNEKMNQTDEHKQALQTLKEEFNILPMADPYEYVKELQKDFDDSLIEYSDEYYDVLGIER